MNKFSNLFLLLIMGGLFLGCTVTTTSDGKQVNMLPLVADKNRYLEIDGSKLNKIQKLELYSNQLQKFYSNKQYVWLQPLPYGNYKAIDRFTSIPYMLYTFDNNPVRTIENNLFSTQSLSMHQYALAGNKVPIGTHTIVLRSGYNNSMSYTKIENINFEAGKNYIIGRDIDHERNVNVFIAECDVDLRFTPLETEYYIIKKKIVSGIEHGNYKNVKTY